MNTTNRTARIPQPWTPTFPGPFPSQPKLVEVATSVFWRLVELNCATVSRTMEHNLSSLKALAEVRDLQGFVAQQQKSLQTLWKDQEQAVKAASDVIRTGFEELQQQGRPSASETPRPAVGKAATAAAVKASPTKIAAVPTPTPTPAVADTDRLRPDTFEIYTDKAGEYRFRLKAADGSVLLKSEGYKSRSSAVNGVASVKKNAKIDARYQKDTGATGKPAFNLKAGNHQVIGSSKAFASADQMEAAIALIKRSVASSKVDDLTRAA